MEGASLQAREAKYLKAKIRVEYVKISIYLFVKLQTNKAVEVPLDLTFVNLAFNSFWCIRVTLDRSNWNIGTLSKLTPPWT